MSKYAKWALVFLYVLQILVVFREELEHLYETAVASVHRRHVAMPDGKGAHQPVSPAPDPTVIIEAIRAREQMTRSTWMLLAALAWSEPHHEHHFVHPPHEEDKHKDCVRRFRKKTAREYYIGNLWHRIRAFTAPKLRAERNEPVMRTLATIG